MKNKGKKQKSIFFFVGKLFIIFEFELILCQDSCVIVARPFWIGAHVSWKFSNMHMYVNLFVSHHQYDT